MATHDEVGRTVQRYDGWSNILGGLGTSRDKRTSNAVIVQALSYADVEALYEGDDMAARIIDDLPDEMTREWCDVHVEEDKDTEEAAEAQLDELEAQGRFREALSWARAYGGAGIVLGVDDGQADPAKPLDEARLRAVKFLTVFDAFELIPASWYIDPLAEKYGLPETYRIQPRGMETTTATGQRIHESRILRFEGVKVNRTQMRRTRNWGNSVLVRVSEVLSDFGISWGAAAHLVHDFSQAVLRIRGLTDLLANKQDDVVKKRLEMLDQARSVVRAVVLDAGDGEGDSGESFERKSTVVTGLPELLDKFMLRLAGAADMPVSRLMGQAPAGLNATGDSDVRWWFCHVGSRQNRYVRPPLNRLVKLLFLAKDGPTGGKEPENWHISFRPLWQLSELEKADVRLKTAQADAAWVNAQVLTPEEVAVSRFGGDGFSVETHIDQELRNKMAAEDPPPPPPAGAPPKDGALPPPAEKPPAPPPPAK